MGWVQTLPSCLSLTRTSTVDDGSRCSVISCCPLSSAAVVGAAKEAVRCPTAEGEFVLVC